MISKCIQCGLDAPGSPVMLFEGEFYRIHLGLCKAKWYFAHPEKAKQEGLDISFLEQYIRDRENR